MGGVGGKGVVLLIGKEVIDLGRFEEVVVRLDDDVKGL